MTLTRSRLALLAGLLVAALLVTGAQSALSSPSLPPIEADDLLASTLDGAADPPPMAGELTATVGLGLPVALEDDSALGELADGARLRVERSADGLRAALLGQRSERLVVTDGRTLSTWDSRTLEATQTTLPEHRSAKGFPEGVDPLAIAGRLLELAGRHADVAVDGTARVAGRPAYRLALTPTDAGTTLGRVEVDIDAEHRVPLRTALFARGAEAPSIELAWTRVSFDPIDPAVFAFEVPPGGTLVERSEHPGHPPVPADAPGPLALLQALSQATGGAGPVVYDGFASVAVLPLPAGADAPDLPALDGPLLSVRVTEVAGQRIVLLGLVPLERLDEVAAGLPTAP